jgi:alpha-mannosidase
VTSVHVVPHTHWDREWYRPFQGYRMRLVDAVDGILDLLEDDPRMRFTLDGQVAIVDDYLEIRPAAEERIRSLVRSGRLAIGPWMILMDEFLASGECIVRNLEMGWRRAEELGGPMRVGHLPDMFGHVAQMPQILRRCGVTDAVVWRGVPAAIDRHAFRWESPDGSTVRAEYLRDGYDNAIGLLGAPDRMEAAVARLAEAAGAWLGTDPVLAMAGTDHSAPDPALSALAGVEGVRIVTLPDYLAAVGETGPDAPSWRGELRSGARANLLMGVASARIDVKRAAARAERRLERYAEPLSAIHLAAGDWPEAYLRLAWRRVVESSAHDSIGGCSVDEVVDQVVVRFAEAEQIAAGLAREAAAAVAADVPRDAFAVLNPSPTRRFGVVEVEATVPDAWEHVSIELPDSRRIATQELARTDPHLLDVDLRGSEVDDLFRRFHGREVFDHAWNGFRIEGHTLTLDVADTADPAWLDVDALRDEVAARLRSEPEATWRVRIEARPRRTLAVSVPVPALGWTAARPVEGAGELDAPVRVAPDGRAMTNGLVSIAIAADGTLRVESADGAVAESVARIVDGGDAGDAYNHATPATDTLVDLPRDLTIAAQLRGPVVGRVRVDRIYEWPVGLVRDGSARTAETVATEVRMSIELCAGEPFVRIGLAFDNASDDHRVRFVAPLRRPAAASHAEGQFAVVERGLTAEGGYREEPLPTFPARGWIAAGGLAILLDHVAEYELTDGGRELSLTVLRSIGLLSRSRNPARLDPAGPELPIPGAQLRGPWQVSFGLLVHRGDWYGSGVAEAAERYAHPLLVARGTGGPDERPRAEPDDVLALDGPNVVLTSLRRRADGWLEARIVNLASDEVRATLRGAITEAREATLLGDPVRAMDPVDGALDMTLGPAEIRTVQLRRRERTYARPRFADAGPRLNR